jgi:hypothetical protein
MVNRIKHAYRMMKRRKCLRKFQKSVFKSIGYITELNEIPTDLLIYIFSFLEKKELYLVSHLSKDLHEVAFDQSLWRSFQLRNQKKYQICEALPRVYNKLEGLQILNFSFCDCINEQACSKIAPFINRGTLKELYLDGCENITDA